MMLKTLCAAALVITGLGAARADSLAADGQWLAFDVAQDLSGTLGWIHLDDGSALQFDVVVPTGFVGELTVVDAGFAGDVFQVSNGATVLGSTSAASQGYPSSIGLDFDAALASSAYSRGVFTLAAGSYSITGALSSSALDDTGLTLNTTVGGIRLTVSPVPEPAPLLGLLAGLGLLTLHRRGRGNV